MLAKLRSEILILEFLVPVIAVILSFLVGAIFILAIGSNPLHVYGQMFGECFGTGYGFAQVLQKTTQLIFTGLAVALAFRVGLFNIGAEGQLYLGAFLVALAGWLLGGLPALFLIPLCILAALIGGALWAGIPGLLKAFFGAHEVITTIMMNFIAIALMSFLINQPAFSVKETVHTPAIAEAAQLPRLSQYISSFSGSTASLSFLIALIAAGAVWYLLWRTRTGYEMRAVGHNPHAAEYGGINVRKTIVITMLISGGLAGLVGVDFVMGYKHYFEEGFSSGLGFLGIAVALLGRNHPLGVVLAAFLLGTLNYGEIALTEAVPKEIIGILQAIIIIMVVTNSKIVKRWTVKWKKARLERDLATAS
jgi:simple sugar transport system permease protein